MNNTNKELEINPTVLLDQAKMIERMVDIDDYKEAEDIFFQMLDSYREQGVKELLKKMDIDWLLKEAERNEIGKVISHLSYLQHKIDLTTQEDQLIVKE